MITQGKAFPQFEAAALQRPAVQAMLIEEAELGKGLSPRPLDTILQRHPPCDFTNVGANVPGIEIPGIDAVKIAQGYGMVAVEVDRPQDLAPTLRQALAAKGPYLISVNVQKGGQTTFGMDKSVNPPNYG